MGKAWRSGLAALAMVCFGLSAANAQPGAEAFGALPAISDAAISPDGQRLIIAAAEGDLTGYRIIEIDGGRTLFGARIAAGQTLRGVGWADDQHATFTITAAIDPDDVVPYYSGFRGNPNLVVYARLGLVDIATHRQVYVEGDRETGWSSTNLTTLTAPIEGDPGYGRLQAFALTQRGYRAGLYRVSFETGRSTRMQTTGNANTVQLLLDQRGEVVARTDADDITNQWRLFVYENGRPRPVVQARSETGSPNYMEGRTGDGRIIFTDNIEGDRTVLFAYNPAGGAREILHESPRYDIEGAITDPWSHTLVGVGWTEDLPKQRFFEPDLAAIADTINAQFADGYSTILSWSRDRSRILLFGEHANDAGGYYVYDAPTRRLLMAGHAYPQLDSAALGRRQAITYPARDRTRIPAYLTLPDAGSNFPLVLLVHGGPHARDTFAFDWWASFLASRGYAVLQPNYRGSTGYGKAWMEAGRGQWGDGLMQHDVTDGVAALARAGIIDPSRVCIVGASYGGYAALAGATLTPDLYKCAIAVAGVSDVQQMLREAAQRSGSRGAASDWWRLSIGDPRADREHLRAISPANLAANVRAPILLIHGELDTTVPISQSVLMDERLREAGKNVRFVRLAGDDHFLSTAATRTQMLREIEAFLAQHLAAAPLSEPRP